MSIDRQLRTGGDPRALADYGALREELSKLTHPARPDVNWKKVEQLCLGLFQQNGIELQTASWYTQARTQLAGLSGLNEGLAIIDALVSRQWAGLWPQPVHARMEILSGLSQRLQQALRSITLEYHDLPQIYQAEKLINALCDVLQRLELRHASQLAALSTLMHSAAIRLENMHATTDPAVVLPAQPERTEKEWATDNHEPWVYVGHAEPSQPQVVIAASPPAKRPLQWKGFVAGVVATVLIGSGIQAGRHAFHPPTGEQLTATLPVLPKPMTPQALEQLKTQQPDMLKREAPVMISATQQQINRLAKLSPRWAQDTGTQLVNQTRTLWPENSSAAELAKKWNLQLTANAISPEDLNSWHDANVQLQQLADKLNALDGQRGRYMTGSELKTAVFALQQTLGKAPPVEESLRKLSQAKQQGTVVSPALTMQLDNQFTQLLNRYALLAPGPNTAQP